MSKKTTEDGEGAALVSEKTLPPHKANATALASTVIRKFLKITPRPARSPEEVARDHLLESPLFSSLDPKHALAFIKQGCCRVVLEAPRDQLIDPTDHLIVVFAGQINLAWFDVSPTTEQALERARRPAKSGAVENKIAKPLSSVADYNLCQFSVGHLIDFQKIQKNTRPSPSKQYQLVLFSNTPVSYALITADCLLEIQSRLSVDAQENLRTAQESTERRLPHGQPRIDNYADDFYIRHGLSVASTIRVLDLEKCVWCKKCEIACADRYGAKRIDLEVIKKESRLTAGILALAGTCRTCTDQRCVDACGYSAIRFDENRREVVISEDKCVGCTACANACPYHAIEMQEIAEGSYFNKKLAERLGNKKTPERTLIASKCDHCADYGGVQACITACPEEALFESSPGRMIGLLNEQNKSSPTLLPPSGLIISSPLKPPGLQASKPSVLAPVVGRKIPWYWLCGLVLWMLSLAEIVSLKQGYGKIYSLVYSLIKRGSIFQRRGTYYYAGNAYSKKVAIFATLLLSIAMLYPLLQRAFQFKTRDGARSAWRQFLSANFHAFISVMGAAFVLTHSDAQIFSVKTTNIYSAVAVMAFWLMLTLLITGWLGAQLYTSSLVKCSAYEEKARQVEAQLEAHVSPYTPDLAPSLFSFATKFALDLGSGAAVGARARRSSLRSSVRSLPLLLFAVSPAREELEAGLTQLQDGDVKRKAVELLSILCRFRLRGYLWGQLAPLTQLLKRMHRPLALAFLIVAALHILRPN